MVVEILLFILAIASLIFLHELGHFLAARLLGIEVEEFGIGFPPRITKLFEFGGTEFTLNWIPLGGFVRPKGENDPDVPGGLAAAKPLARILVLVAGPFMNLLAAGVIYAIIVTRLGVDLTKVDILYVAEDTPAEVAGIKSGDIVVSVNDKTIRSTRALRNTIYDNLDQEIDITLSRLGDTYTTSLTPRSNPPEGQGAIGIVMSNPISRVEIKQIAPNSPAEAAGLLVGDIIIAINETIIFHEDKLVSLIASQQGEEIAVVVARGEEMLTFTLVPLASPPSGYNALGIQIYNPVSSIGPLKALYMGGIALVDQSRAFIELPKMLISGEISTDQRIFVGYKGMFDIFMLQIEEDTTNATSRGVNTLSFFAIISISLGLLNLIPTPALDGGRIVFALQELITRRRVPQKYENLIHLVGLAVLLIFLIYVNIQDFINPIDLSSPTP